MQENKSECFFLNTVYMMRFDVTTGAHTTRPVSTSAMQLLRAPNITPLMSVERRRPCTSVPVWRRPDTRRLDV